LERRISITPKECFQRLLLLPLPLLLRNSPTLTPEKGGHCPPK